MYKNEARIKELKVMAYDCLTMIEQAQTQLREVNNELAKELSKPKEVAVEKSVKKDAKAS